NRGVSARTETVAAVARDRSAESDAQAGRARASAERDPRPAPSATSGSTGTPRVPSRRPWLVAVLIGVALARTCIWLIVRGDRSAQAEARSSGVHRSGSAPSAEKSGSSGDARTPSETHANGDAESAH